MSEVGMADRWNGWGGRRAPLAIGIVAALLLLAGCGHFNETRQAKPTFAEADRLFNQGSYQESLDKYRQIVGAWPMTGDRALFEMGIVYSYPKNERKDYEQALACFRKVVAEYPASDYRANSETMIFYLTNAPLKDRTIAAQQTQLDTLRRELAGKDDELAALRQKIAELEKNVFAYAIEKPAIDKIVIEKGARRLMLLCRGEVLKSYRIALGGNPVGPKERRGDNKTPEGTYVIDSRNHDSRYHCALHISYPNERDKKRARELGVSPGGDIMIHGVKNGYEWVGDAQAAADWTKGCIAVTDREIDEIDKLVANGTAVEIRP
ncbi:transpeptidase [Geotalea uraniireducens]|uniref:Transpeptidase n=2 Tax=Geotalea uraniireducens TaxID=351604 RepID=A0ABN6VPF7_9BACT|nr:transpeptidase [Geotalea uraniireducens]